MGIKVLLANPIVKFPANQNGDIGVPLGLLYLAAHLREHNHSAEVIFRPYRLEHQLGKVSNLQAEFAEVDIVASGGSTSEMPDVLEMFRVAKQLGKKTIAGGIFPTTNVEPLLRSGLVDILVRGEGDATFPQVISALESMSGLEGVRGISYLKDGEVVHNPRRKPLDMRELSLPAYDLAPMNDYVRIANGAIYGARGCNNSCNFCTLSSYWHNTYRPRPVASVIQEMEALINYGFKRIHFKDESLLQDRERATELFTTIRDANLGIKVKGKARLDQVDDEMLELLKSAGVDMLHVGVESVSYESLQRMGKKLKVSDIRGSLDRILSHGIRVNPVYIFSWPGETADDLRMNADFIKSFGSQPNVVSYISFITPHPGTELHRESPGNGLRILTHDLNRYTHKQPVALPESLGPDGMELMVKTYNSIGRELGMEHVNPPISDAYIESLRSEACC